MLLIKQRHAKFYRVAVAEEGHGSLKPKKRGASKALLGGPPPLPLLGNVGLVFSHGGPSFMHCLFHQVAQAYGGMFLVWLGVKPFVVVNEPELVKQIFMPKHFKTFKKGMFSEIMRPLLGDGLLLSEASLGRKTGERKVSPEGDLQKDATKLHFSQYYSYLLEDGIFPLLFLHSAKVLAECHDTNVVQS
ncbi:hypothetical protein QOT17_012160 [Balamuthia mandrillaris]